MSVKTFEKLTALLDKHQARYRVVEHPPPRWRKRPRFILTIKSDNLSKSLYYYHVSFNKEIYLIIRKYISCYLIRLS